MRAVRIHEWNSPPVVDELPAPVRGPGESLVRIEAATVSHLDDLVASGRFGVRPELPYVPGVEGSAIVLESDTHPIGSQVIFRDGPVGLRADGTWRELATVPDDTLLPQAVRLDPSVAACFFVPVTTAYVAVHDVGMLAPGETIMVSGASGAVGSVVVQLALAHGAEVIALVSRASRLSLVPAGATAVDLGDERAVAALARERPAHLLVDTVGGHGLSTLLPGVTAGGRAVGLGHTAGRATTLDLPSWFYSDVTLSPVNMLSRGSRAETIGRMLLGKVAF